MTPDETETATEVFEASRGRLAGLAYRMLGSVAEAEDAVQDTFLKWRAAERTRIEAPEAWLVAVCTRRCLDLLRAAHRSRIDYVGLWLPEPLVGTTPASQADQLERADSLTTAFLILMERLNPVERAAYLLREVFDYDYRSVAAILDRSEPASRQIVARAKKRLGSDSARSAPVGDHQEQLLSSFLEALESGRAERLEQVLADDVELWGDGGGRVPAGGLEVIRSAPRVAAFLAQVWQLHWRDCTLERALVNGGAGVILHHRGRVDGAMSLAADETGRCVGLFVVRNPDKLAHIPAADTAH